ncbi:MAG: aminoglycoside phosphotransferase family protein [Clostridiales bacterium]|nr:aminoglycoside phosphotransferase family protein [Clostridiales bacterium]
MSNVKRINRQSEIDAQEINVIMGHMCKGLEVQEVTLIAEGLSTTNYKVRVKDHIKRYLLKIYPLNRLDNTIEYSFMNKLRNVINVPEIHVFDTSKTLIKYDYMIMDFIEGSTLSHYVKQQMTFDSDLAYKIGSSLAKIHVDKFNKMALLDKHQKIKKTLIPISELISFYQTTHAGSHLSFNSVKHLEFIHSRYKDILRNMDHDCVLSHGDFNPNNIIVDEMLNLWFIDFEFSMSAPRYLDIGKLFRKRSSFNDYMTVETIDSFTKGYQEISKEALPMNWLEYSKVVDITSLLSLINKKETHKDWIEYVEKTIEEFVLSIK